MVQTLPLWLPVLIFLGIHQLEEVFLSIHDWSLDHPLPRWARFVRNAIMLKAAAMWQRVAIVAVQTAVFFAMAWVLSPNQWLLRLFLTVLVVAWMAAFGLHLALSRSTHSWMPGSYTSVLPGIPAGLALMWWLWSAHI